MAYQKRTSLRGFTLVEILMVVVILGIASAVIIPQLNSRSDLLAGAAARQVMSDLTYAQNYAITRQTPTYVSFKVATTESGPGGSYSVCSALPSTRLAHPVSKNPWMAEFGAGQSYSTIRLDAATFDTQTALMFDETGAPYSISANGGSAVPLSSGSIRITCNGYSLTVRMEPLTGSLSVQ